MPNARDHQPSAEAKTMQPPSEPQPATVAAEEPVYEGADERAHEGGGGGGEEGAASYGAIVGVVEHAAQPDEEGSSGDLGHDLGPDLGPDLGLGSLSSEAAGHDGEEQGELLLLVDGNVPENIQDRVVGVKRKVDGALSSWQAHAKRMRIELHNRVDNTMDLVDTKVKDNIARLDQCLETTLDKCVAELATARNRLEDVGAAVRANGNEIHCDD